MYACIHPEYFRYTCISNSFVQRYGILWFTQIYTCSNSHIYMHIDICIYANMYYCIFIYIFLFTHTYIYIYIHTELFPLYMYQYFPSFVRRIMVQNSRRNIEQALGKRISMSTISLPSAFPLTQMCVFLSSKSQSF